MPQKWTQLIALRKAAGLSQYDLANRLNMTRSSLGNYEMGVREPDFETTMKIATFFNVTVDELLGRSPKEDSPAGEIPEQWRRLISLAKAEGYEPDQVLQALRLLGSIRKQQKDEKEEERKGSPYAE